MGETSQPVPAKWWAGDEGEPKYEDATVGLEVERDDSDANMIAVHTMHEGRGSLSSYYLDRENARRLALRLLLASELPL